MLTETTTKIANVWPDFTGIHNYLTKWLIRINSDIVNRTKKRLITRKEKKAPPLTLP